MIEDKPKSLLGIYFKMGKLNQRYYDGKNYCQPYSAEDRLRAGELFYNDFIGWQKGVRLIQDYSGIKVDSGFAGKQDGLISERFRRALKRLPKASLPVVYKIVLNETDIMAPHSFSEREKTQFYGEIRSLLCRGLDALCSFYAHVFSVNYV